ncbi:MAG: hypothetical protein AAF629_16580 [Chloroflexota bacterium]
MTNHPNLIFWGSYIFLNLLLFVPLYVLNQHSTYFFPLSATTEGFSITTLKELLLWRNNFDIFRLNSEMLFLVSLWVFVPWLRLTPMHHIYRWLCGLLYFIILIYAAYEGIMLTLYQVDPVFYSQFWLVADGLEVLVRNLELPWRLYFFGGIGFITFVVVIGKLIGLVIGGVPVERLSIPSKVGLALLTLVVMFSVAIYRSFLASPQMQISSFTYKLRHNIIASAEAYERVNAYDDGAAQDTYNYTAHKLLRTPNIYLIFIESYGSVLYKRPDYKEQYLALVPPLEAQLSANDWHVASTLSEAPTWGGGSWMAYTSLLFGLRVDTHAQYLSLVDQYQTADYPDLGQYLKSQGYTYLRLSSLSDELKEDKQQVLRNFYGVDDWPTYSDLNFTGRHFGWGPAPPDQYALSYIYQTRLQHLETPFFLFYVTQNSHFPWVPLPEVADDWRTLNKPPTTPEPELPSTIPHQVKRQNYFNSIDYELTFLTDYIIKMGGKDSIFILIGDHQPPQVSRHNDSFDTPIHIISQDKGLTDRLDAYGFVPGFAVQDEVATIRHEGFYSMFVRLLNDRYGNRTRALPKYRPWGIPIGE